MPVRTKVVKGKKYLYFREYDPVTRKKWDRYCGPADDPIASALARDLERKHDTKLKIGRERHLAPFEIEMEIIEHLGAKPDGYDGICGSQNLDASSAGQLVDLLVQKGLIERNTSGLFELTAEGRRRREQIRKGEYRLSFMASSIARHADMIPEEKAELLQEVYDSVLKKLTSESAGTRRADNEADGHKIQE